MRKISDVTSSLMEKGARLTGALTGNAGAESRVTTREDRALVLERLKSNRPEETDAGLLTWLKSQGVVAQPEIRLTYPTTGGYRREVTGFSFEGLTPEINAAARLHTRQAMTRADIDDCEAWVTTMHAVMAHRGSSATALEVVLTVYANCLRGYPADVAKTVCHDFALRREKPNWFPTLSELDEACEKATNQRLQLLGSLIA